MSDYTTAYYAILGKNGNSFTINYSVDAPMTTSAGDDDKFSADEIVAYNSYNDGFGGFNEQITTYVGQYGDGIVVHYTSTYNGGVNQENYYLYSNTPHYVGEDSFTADPSDLTACFLAGTQVMTPRACATSKP